MHPHRSIRFYLIAILCEVLARRWVVERTFSWLSQNRRTSRDYERLCATGEAFIYVAMSRLMARRLARS
jgi:putative transposase